MLNIGIFPASGGLGSSTYTHLLNHVPNDKVTLIARFPEKIPGTYVQNGARVRKASYESDPQELEAAFADIEVLFLISYPSHVRDYRVKRDELGEATAKLIERYAADPAAFEFVNAKVLLTGNKPWTLAETVRCLGEALGKEVRIREVSVEEYARQTQVEGRFGSAAVAESWATAWEAIRAGETAVVTRTLAEILGRTPEDFDQTIKQLLSQQRD
ncbi:unnamed protein product [Parascedosporium putredinis]|uniref:NAD(P)-binding domain-containing protein n=1 Tax=Parascedosporium putredinis TaxID=1442378 RepID=A0A9P1MAN5_9PEZI|nr:unnamed protein product [Parascedosporium putredinis]CAI7993098.1 unnamed protein product [Parascedosporium putredinis]